MRPVDIFDRGSAIDSSRVCLVDGAEEIDYADAQQRTYEIARGLSALGIQKGDVVAILTPNRPETLLSVLGIWRTGAIWAAVNPRNSAAANAEMLMDVDCRVLIVDAGFAAEAREIQGAAPCVRHIVSLDEAFEGSIGSSEFLQGGKGAHLADWGDAFANPDDDCAYLGTGGTTGRSKVVRITNRVWATMQNLAERTWPDMQQGVNLVVAPMTHAAGVMAAMFAGTGSTIVIHGRFDAARVLDAIETHHVTHFFVPPTAFYELVRLQEVAPRDCSSLKMLLVSAAPVAPEMLGRGSAVFNGTVAQCYGQAEAPMLLTHLDAEVIAAAQRNEHPERLASCGRPTPNVVMGIMDDQGKLLPAGEIGEIVARSHLVTPGYLNRRDETAQSKRHGWHHTGDVGMIDEHGFVFVKDRLKDMIISGGFNVYASEVEAALHLHPQVDQCAVIGVPDAKWGEAVTAVVVARDGFSDELALIAHAKAVLGSVKAPKSIVFVDRLPTTSVGKINKVEIRSQYWAGHDRAVN